MKLYLIVLFGICFAFGNVYTSGIGQLKQQEVILLKHDKQLNEGRQLFGSHNKALQRQQKEIRRLQETAQEGLSYVRILKHGLQQLGAITIKAVEERQKQEGRLQVLEENLQGLNQSAAILFGKQEKKLKVLQQELGAQQERLDSQQEKIAALEREKAEKKRLATVETKLLQDQINAQQGQINIICRVAKGFSFVLFCALGVAVANPGLFKQLLEKVRG